MVGARGDFCRWLKLATYVSSSVAPLIGSSVGHYVSWSSPLAQKMRDTPFHYRIRSIRVCMDFHRCAEPGSECAFTDITCVVPIVALCQLNPVLLDFHVATDVYNIACKVDALPRLRFLRVLSNPAPKSLSIDAVSAVTRHCPALETLSLRKSSFRDGALAPKQKAPFRLRCLCIEAGDVDGRTFAWLCGSSVGLLQHLKLDGGCSENLRDIAWTETDIAKAALAVLPRLTVLFHAKLCATHLISFTPNLTHLTTNVDSVPSLDVLPSSLTNVHRDGWYREREFLPEGRLRDSDQVVTVSASKSVSDRIFESRHRSSM